MYPKECSEFNKYLKGHILVGVIFKGDDGAYKPNSKVYSYWAPARYVRYLGSETHVIVSGIEKRVRIVSIAQPRNGLTYKRISTSEQPPKDADGQYREVPEYAHDLEQYFFNLMRALDHPFGRFASSIAERIEQNKGNLGAGFISNMRGQQAAMERATERFRQMVGGPQVPGDTIVLRGEELHAELERQFAGSLQATVPEWAVESTTGVLEMKVVDRPNMPRAALAKWHEQGTFHINKSFYIPKPVSLLESYMSTNKIEIDNVTFINGKALKDLTNEEVFATLSEINRKIGRLESLPVGMRPKRLEAELQELHASANALVEALDTADAAEGKAAADEAAAFDERVSAAVRKELRVLRHEEDVVPKKPVPAMPVMPAMPDSGA